MLAYVTPKVTTGTATRIKTYNKKIKKLSEKKANAESYLEICYALSHCSFRAAMHTSKILAHTISLSLSYKLARTPTVLLFLYPISPIKGRHTTPSSQATQQQTLEHIPARAHRLI